MQKERGGGREEEGEEREWEMEEREGKEARERERERERDSKGERGRRERKRLTLDFADAEGCREILKSIEHPFHNVVREDNNLFYQTVNPKKQRVNLSQMTVAKSLNGHD